MFLLIFIKYFIAGPGRKLSFTPSLFNNIDKVVFLTIRLELRAARHSSHCVTGLTGVSRVTMRIEV